MDHEHQRGRGRHPLASRVGVLVVVATALTIAGMSLRPPTAQARALEDASTPAARAIVEQLAAADATLRATQGAIPQAAADLLAAVAAAEAAKNTPTDGHLSSPVGSGAGSVADSAAGAILGDLGLERAESALTTTAGVLATARARTDELDATLASATAQRAQLVQSLEAAGHARTRWSVALLDRLGFPVTMENIRALAAWIGAEANNARFRNPLATTMGAAGATNVNEVGVKSYPTDDIGLDATVRTLTNGLYEPILDALRAGDSAVRVVAAVAASPWGTGENAVIRLRQDG
ncbi:MAG: hypothetical protein R6X23_07745 [Acidimicrobiia bacterium]